MNDLSMLPMRVAPIAVDTEGPVVYRADIAYPLIPGNNIVHFSKPLTTNQYDVRPVCYKDGMNLSWSLGWKNEDCFMITVDEDCFLDYTLLPVR